MLQRKYAAKAPKKPKGKRSGHLGSRSGVVELVLWDEDGPGLAGLAEHLLGLEELTLLEDHGPNGLGRCGGGVEDLLDSVDEGDGDLGRLVVSAALDEDLAGGVGVLGLAGVALRQELHARRRAWVQGVELDPHPR
ncbi:hypothetical protein TIFTF001_003267 [Ficus carica]|uniref:Uncharacterized protein n=1 Tax=Ficus carica TaxID=3494 RepID=A0AA87ZRS0_FICCA|nr:hypothetical protein TIFTF001_003267 [Ficus carica]